MESRTRQFGQLFSLKITHAYFPDQACPYLRLEPDPSCRLLLVKKRLICKEVCGELKLIAEKTGYGLGDEGKAVTAKRKAVPARAGADISGEVDHYRFIIRLTDTTFLRVTKLDLSGYPGQLLYFSNNPKNLRLSAKKCPNPGRLREAVLGIVDIGISGSELYDKNSREPFLIPFEAADQTPYL